MAHASFVGKRGFDCLDVAKRRAGSFARGFGGESLLDELFGPHREVKLDLVVHIAWRVGSRIGHPKRLFHTTARARPTAWEYICQRVVSRRSCARPLAVSL